MRLRFASPFPLRPSRQSSALATSHAVPRLATLALVALCLLPGRVVEADESISKEYRAAVKEFLELGNSSEMGEQIAYLMADQTLTAIAATGAPITESLGNIVLEEARKEFEPTFSDIDYLTDLHAPLYKEYFTEKEIQDLVAFYTTPLGKKMTEALPQISQAAGMALQQASYDMVPDYQAKVDARLKEAGMVVTPTP